MRVGRGKRLGLAALTLNLTLTLTLTRYVEALDDGWCRVYYSTDSQVPGWVPGFMKDQIVNLAAKRSTSWVDIECKKAMGITKPKTSDAPTPLGRLSNLAARGLIVGYLLRRVIVPRELLSRLAATRLELRSPIVLRRRDD